MDLKLADTLMGEKRLFVPISPQKVGLYYCGPTVYWTQHIGNLRGAVCVDLVVRTLQYNNYVVNFVRNYTDVGHLSSDADAGIDRMEKAVIRDRQSPNEIAEKYIYQYENDTKLLNLLEPTAKPRATAHISEMIELINTLLEKGFAYKTNLAIYFDVSRATDYTRLSKQHIDMNRAGAGTGTIDDKQKRRPEDFALWFFKTGAHENAIQTWPSPLHSQNVADVSGFPGWHIECSAMSKAYLGGTIDIHLGGIEHIPVHHTNEIAQSESANGLPFVHYWLHNEHLLVDNRKMAKSEGTVYSLDELIQKGFDPLSLRYFFLTAHYRSSQNFTWEALAQSETAYKKLCAYISEHEIDSSGTILSTYEHEFHQAINDDINIPKALGIMWTMLRDQRESPADIIHTILAFDTVLGLGLDHKPKQYLDIPTEISTLLEKRTLARDQKNWELADSLRIQIESLGYTLKDTDKGSKLTLR